MKFPSIQTLATASLSTLRRFPLVLLSAFMATAAIMYSIEHHESRTDKIVEQIVPIILTCYLGLTLFLSLKIFAESQQLGKKFNYLIHLGGLLLLIAYYFSLPNTQGFNIVHTSRFALFTVALHLLVSFAAFADRHENKGFWKYNEILFLRILASALYTGVLIAGLVLALLAIENLFNIEFYKNTYLHLICFLVGIFSAWFFLAGLPQNFELLKDDHSYPKGLKLFTQYVLLPLVTVYLLILYAYGLKIALAWDLPQGWVSYLVLALSIVGILSILLIYPIKDKEGNGWIKTFSRWFYIALLPLIVLLFLAIYKRISDYGITEDRYLVLVLALWLCGIALFFTFSREKNIKIIPVSLCALTLLSSAGPWGAFSTAQRSQQNRFEEILLSNRSLIDGKIKLGNDTLSFKDRKNISSIVSYFTERDALEELQPYFTAALDTIIDDSINYRKAEAVLNLVGIKYVAEYETENHDSGTRNFRTMQTNTLETKGYDYYVDYFYNEYQENPDTTVYSVLKITYDTTATSLILLSPQDQIMQEIHLDSLFKTIANKYSAGTYNNDIPVREMTLIFEGSTIKYKLLMDEFEITEASRKRLKLSRFNVKFLFTIKDQL